MARYNFMQGRRTGLVDAEQTAHLRCPNHCQDRSQIVYIRLNNSPKKPPLRNSRVYLANDRESRQCACACTASDVAPYRRTGFLFVVAGGGADPLAVFVGHRGAVVFVGIQPMEDQRLYDPLGI